MAMDAAENRNNDDNFRKSEEVNVVVGQPVYQNAVWAAQAVYVPNPPANNSVDLNAKPQD